MKTGRMRFYSAVLIGAIMVLFSGGTSSPVVVETDEMPPLYVPGEVIVRFNPGVQRDNIEGFYQEYGVEEIEDLGRRGRGNDREEKVIWVPPHQAWALVY